MNNLFWCPKKLDHYSYLGIAEDLDPLGKVEVGGNDQGCFFVQMANEVEE